MSAALLPAVEINPPGSANACVICLHGLGADGHDLESIVSELHLPERHGIRFLFPHAPRRPITINNGYIMRGWYDIFGFGLGHREDDLGIRESENSLSALIEREIKNGIAADHIILAGFSQGGAIALHTALRHAQRLAGVIALSTYVPLANTLAAELHPTNKGLPIFFGHGVHDGIIPLNYASASRDILQQHGYDVTWRTYPMAHTLSVAEIQDVSTWLAGVLG